MKYNLWENPLFYHLKNWLTERKCFSKKYLLRPLEFAEVVSKMTHKVKSRFTWEIFNLISTKRSCFILNSDGGGLPGIK